MTSDNRFAAVPLKRGRQSLAAAGCMRNVTGEIHKLAPSRAARVCKNDHAQSRRHPRRRGVVVQRVRQRANEIEEPVAAKADMGAVLNASVRPVDFRRSAVALITARAECFKDKHFILFR
jgi:hypothetical protein